MSWTSKQTNELASGPVLTSRRPDFVVVMNHGGPPGGVSFGINADFGSGPDIVFGSVFRSMALLQASKFNAKFFFLRHGFWLHRWLRLCFLQALALLSPSLCSFTDSQSHEL